jgi:hypothetical protein
MERTKKDKRQRWTGHGQTLMLFDHSDMQQLLGDKIPINKMPPRAVKNLKDRFMRRFDPNHPSIRIKLSKADSNVKEWSEQSQLLALVTRVEKQQLLREETKSFRKCENPI